jgi:hypothetical protein
MKSNRGMGMRDRGDQSQAIDRVVTHWWEIVAANARRRADRLAQGPARNSAMHIAAVQFDLEVKRARRKKGEER